MSTNLAASPPRTYGRDLGVNYGAEDAPCIVTRALERAELAVTEIRVDKPLGRLSDPIPREDGFMICYMIREIRKNAYWEGGRQVSAYSLQAGDTTIHDLKREPLALIDKPIHSLLWYLSRATLDMLADQASAPYVDELHYKPGVAVVDDTIKQLSMSLMPALRAPERVSRLFADYVTLAFAAHAAETYGGMRPERLVKGGLAPWQERRSKDMISADLSGATPLTEVAAACGLSVGHFSRAFRKSTGLAPHAWLLQARVERAMSLLRGPEKSLSEIALACGFADQSHLTRVFSGRIGKSPGIWRKLCAS
jgi:AraC family transcriptional regulator